jgi:hypothetical protein
MKTLEQFKLEYSDIEELSKQQIKELYQEYLDEVISSLSNMED